MLDLVLALGIATAASAAGVWLLRPLLTACDPAESLGVGGIAGLGLLGLATFAVGAVPNALSGVRLAAWGLASMGFIVAAFALRRGLVRLPTSPTGRWGIAIVGFLALLPLVGALAPPDTMEWDSLAYHLALPKLWLAANSIDTVPFIHHSYFPANVDALYVWGMAIAGEVGAKTFSFAFFVLGGFALFGIARRWYGSHAGVWSCVAFAGAPVVLWESGTAYIDVAQGLMAGLGALYGVELLTTRHSPHQRRRLIILSGLLLGLAAGSKYTGLVVLAALAVVAVARCFLVAFGKRDVPGASGSVFRDIVAVTCLAIVVCSPGYVRNYMQTGNPMYPFLYERFGGRGWDQWRAEIYANEQRSFGVAQKGKSQRDWTQLPHAILGLAYQPGRYANPGQTQGEGLPIAAVGFALLLGGLLWCYSGHCSTREATTLGIVFVCLMAWFVLSQQSRYAIGLMMPLVVLCAGVVTQLRFGGLMAFAIAAQAIYTAWLTYTVVTKDQLPVVLGRESRSEYLSSRVSFFVPSEAINALPRPIKVALYDEVFGYLLDVPYIWANPPHSTLMSDSDYANVGAFVHALHRLDVTHVYVNLRYRPPDTRSLWHAVAEGRPVEPSQVRSLSQDPQSRWLILTADAVRSGRLRIVEAFRGAALLEVETSKGQR